MSLTATMKIIAQVRSIADFVDMYPVRMTAAMRFWIAQQMAERRELAVGDYVREKDRERPRMKITEMADRLAVCSWWASESLGSAPLRQERTFNVEGLVLWEDAE